MGSGWVHLIRTLLQQHSRHGLGPGSKDRQGKPRWCSAFEIRLERLPANNHFPFLWECRKHLPCVRGRRSSSNCHQQHQYHGARKSQLGGFHDDWFEGGCVSLKRQIQGMGLAAGTLSQKCSPMCPKTSIPFMRCCVRQQSSNVAAPDATESSRLWQA
jgi:hypothetical protein